MKGQEIPAVEVQGEACCHEVGGNTPCYHTTGLITCSSDRAERGKVVGEIRLKEQILGKGT
jgi:hypothetical protein